ncbi:hypothetical protein ABZX12_40980 [Kribbella sp. NPDC003505]|uniref:hypothetical protein n=1 Tax=Kribbella sp. NPDC003505 TaxID=3154448 RepID=UPI0033AACC3E
MGWRLWAADALRYDDVYGRRDVVAQIAQRERRRAADDAWDARVSIAGNQIEVSDPGV